MDREEARLRLALIAEVGNASGGSASAVDVRRAITVAAGIQESSISVVPSHPDNFLVMCDSQDIRGRVLRASPVPFVATSLSVRPWTRLVQADVVTLLTKVTIEMDGIPAHAWDLDTASKLLAPHAWIESIDDVTLRKEDLSTFKVAAWTKDPFALPATKTLMVAESEAPTLHSDPDMQRIFGSLPPYRRQKQVLAYPIVFHLRSIADFRPRSPSTSGPSSPSDDGDSGPDGNPDRSFGHRQGDFPGPRLSALSRRDGWRRRPGSRGRAGGGNGGGQAHTGPADDGDDEVRAMPVDNAIGDGGGDGLATGPTVGAGGDPLHTGPAAVIAGGDGGDGTASDTGGDDITDVAGDDGDNGLIQTGPDAGIYDGSIQACPAAMGGCGAGAGVTDGEDNVGAAADDDSDGLAHAGPAVGVTGGSTQACPAVTGGDGVGDSVVGGGATSGGGGSPANDVAGDATPGLEDDATPGLEDDAFTDLGAVCPPFVTSKDERKSESKRPAQGMPDPDIPVGGDQLLALAASPVTDRARLPVPALDPELQASASDPKLMLSGDPVQPLEAGTLECAAVDGALQSAAAKAVDCRNPDLGLTLPAEDPDGPPTSPRSPALGRPPTQADVLKVFAESIQVKLRSPILLPPASIQAALQVEDHQTPLRHAKEALEGDSPAPPAAPLPPKRSARLANQKLSCVPIVRRGEVILMMKFGMLGAADIASQATKNSYDGVFREKLDMDGHGAVIKGVFPTHRASGCAAPAITAV